MRRGLAADRGARAWLEAGVAWRGTVSGRAASGGADARLLDVADVPEAAFSKARQERRFALRRRTTLVPVGEDDIAGEGVSTAGPRPGRPARLADQQVDAGDVSPPGRSLPVG
jgi:hypothetical protein